MENKQYIHEIHERFKMKLKARYGTIRNVVIGLGLLAIAEIAVYVVLFRVWGVDSAIQQVVSYIIPLVVSGIVLIGVVVYWRYYEVPAEIYSEQQHRIKDLEPSIPTIVVRGFNDRLIFTKRVGIDIYNPNSSDVTDIDVELISMHMRIMQANLTDVTSVVYLIDSSNCHFKEWATAKEPTVKALDHQVIYFAQIEGEALTLFLDRDQLIIYNERNYVSQPTSDIANIYLDINFEVRGKVEGHIFLQIYSTRIDYRSMRMYSDTSKTGTPKIETSIGMEGVERIEQKKEDINEKDTLG